MLTNVKYYNRAYRLLDDLMYTFRDGYNRSEVKSFVKNERYFFNNNPRLYAERYHALMLVMVITLLGLNKESIDNAEKFMNYSTFIPDRDCKRTAYYQFHDKNPMDADPNSIRFFDLKNSVSTPFESWLSIIHTPEGDDDKTIIKRVRNGLLHSNFDMSLDNAGRAFTHIKTRNYFDASILDNNFFHFIIKYYSNTSGLKEKDCLYSIDYDINIKTKDELKKLLSSLKILFYKTKIDNYNGSVYFDKPFEDLHSLSNDIIIKGFNSLIEEGMDIRFDSISCFTEDCIDIMADHIISFYPDFFNYDYNEKLIVIGNIVNRYINPKENISSWIAYYMNVLSCIIDCGIDIDTGTTYNIKFAKDTSKISLLLVKAYLVMYRLQYIKTNSQDDTKFDDIDYDSIDFDFGADDYLINIYNDNDSSFSMSTLIERQRQRDNTITDEDAIGRILISIIRNGLAHGNIRPVYIPNKGEFIKIFDVNPRNTDENKVILMTLDKFEKFLNSSAFLPNNCYSRSRSLNLHNN